MWPPSVNDGARCRSGRPHGFAALSRHNDSALEWVHHRDGSGAISPQPRARAVSSCPALTCRVVGRFAMQRSRSAIVLEVITAAAVVALVLYVLFPPN
jgi:hypothetical protein